MRLSGSFVFGHVHASVAHLEFSRGLSMRHVNLRFLDRFFLCDFVGIFQPALQLDFCYCHFVRGYREWSSKEYESENGLKEMRVQAMHLWY